MAEIGSRLEKCFALVFPRLSGQEIGRAAMGSVEGWDSLASINLLTVIEEEFALQIPAQDLEQLASFPAILEYLTRLQPAC